MNLYRALSSALVAGALLVTVPLARAELAERQAAAYIRQGALVVDVRTVEEFQAKHLAGVTNIPLSEVTQRLPEIVTNQSATILLHCRTGRRSGLAEAELRRQGYTNVFNLGSFERAQRAVQAAR